MNCPTCGKKVKAGQTVCANCGALVGGPAPAMSEAPRGASPFSSPEKKTAAPPKERPAAGEAWPFPETAEAEELPGEAPEPSEQAPPKAPAWVRWISPVFFLLVFLAAQFWLRQSERSRPADDQPVLSQAGLAGEIPTAGPVRQRTEFSLQRDRQVVLLSDWSGSPSGHRYAAEWRSPDGATHPSSRIFASSRAGGRGFSVIATLELDRRFPLGEWWVEIFQDGRPITRRSFQLRE